MAAFRAASAVRTHDRGTTMSSLAAEAVTVDLFDHQELALVGLEGVHDKICMTSSWLITQPMKSSMLARLAA